MNGEGHERSRALFIVNGLDTFLGIAFLVCVFGTAFSGYFWLYYNPQILYARSISKDELLQMSAEEYITLMRRTPTLIIPDNIDHWPKPRDIPYLLDIVEKTEYAGSTIDTKTSAVQLKDEYKSTVGINAVFLLKAIKENAMHPYMTDVYPQDKHEIIAWARAEAAKMEAASNPKKPE